MKDKYLIIKISR